jgi:hypothetical protein
MSRIFRRASIGKRSSATRRPSTLPARILAGAICCFTHPNAKTSSPLTLEFLRIKLERAQLVDDEEIDTPFVQIGTHVLFADERGETYRVTLTVPESGDSPDHVSILASVGAALLRISQGHLISYETPDKRIKTLTVVDLSEHPPQRS